MKESLPTTTPDPDVVVHHEPNAESLTALEEVVKGEVVSFESWDAFFADLYDIEHEVLP